MWIFIYFTVVNFLILFSMVQLIEMWRIHIFLNLFQNVNKCQIRKIIKLMQEFGVIIPKMCPRRSASKYLRFLSNQYQSPKWSYGSFMLISFEISSWNVFNFCLVWLSLLLNPEKRNPYGAFEESIDLGFIPIFHLK